MVFNSYIFIFVFLPIVFLLCFILQKNKLYTAFRIVLALASVVFCAYGNNMNFVILILSIVINYFFGKKIIKTKNKQILIAGLILNIATLGLFKYTNFFLTNINTLFNSRLLMYHIIIPIGLSFYIFQQISFLVDGYHGKIESDKFSFLNYFLYVSFFPKLMEGPIARYSELEPQFEDNHRFEFNIENCTRGLVIFLIGLFKKTIIADNLILWVSAGFNNSTQITFIEAWAAALAFTFQLYFDFSGYSDMAIGLGLMFNIEIPINFNSPYKSLSVIEFWKRWHISLSRFLQDYLYIPLGGNRKGRFRKYLNLIITMLLGGLWHGAGWTFVAWGAIHGVYLLINHLFRDIKKRYFHSNGSTSKNNNTILSKLIAVISPARILTFVAVTFAWVIFRASNITVGIQIIKAMLGFNGFSIHKLIFLPGKLKELEKLVLLWAWVTYAPNTLEAVKKFKFNYAWAVAVAVMGSMALASVNKITQFIYNQF